MVLEDGWKEPGFRHVHSRTEVLVDNELDRTAQPRDYLGGRPGRLEYLQVCRVLALRQGRMRPARAVQKCSPSVGRVQLVATPRAETACLAGATARCNAPNGAMTPYKGLKPVMSCLHSDLRAPEAAQLGQVVEG